MAGDDVASRITAAPHAIDRAAFKVAQIALAN